MSARVPTVADDMRSPRRIRSLPRILWSAIRKFDADNGFFLAAGVSFNLLLSVIPLILLLLSIFGSYLHSDAEVTEHVADYFRTLFPNLNPKIMDSILSVIQTRRFAGLLAIAGLAWTASMLFSSLRISLDHVFGVEVPRGTLKAWAVDLLMILVAGATLLASMLLTSGVEVVRRYSLALPLDFGTSLVVLFKYVIPLIFTFLMCFFVYKIVPDRKPSLASSLEAALFTSLFWETAKQLFGWYVVHAKTYTLIYGSLSTVALLFLGVYYSAAIFLLGAEVACILDQHASSRPPAPTGG